MSAAVSRRFRFAAAGENRSDRESRRGRRQIAAMIRLRQSGSGDLEFVGRAVLDNDGRRRAVTADSKPTASAVLWTSKLFPIRSRFVRRSDRLAAAIDVRRAAAIVDAAIVNTTVINATVCIGVVNACCHVTVGYVGPSLLLPTDRRK